MSLALDALMCNHSHRYVGRRFGFGLDLGLDFVSILVLVLAVAFGFSLPFGFSHVGRLCECVCDEQQQRARATCQQACVSLAILIATTRPTRSFGITNPQFETGTATDGILVNG
jgi:hypothetical protein